MDGVDGAAQSAAEGVITAERSGDSIPESRVPVDAAGRTDEVAKPCLSYIFDPLKTWVWKPIVAGATWFYNTVVLRVVNFITNWFCFCCPNRGEREEESVSDRENLATASREAAHRILNRVDDGDKRPFGRVRPATETLATAKLLLPVANLANRLINIDASEDEIRDDLAKIGKKALRFLDEFIVDTAQHRGLDGNEDEDFAANIRGKNLMNNIELLSEACDRLLVEKAPPPRPDVDGSGT